MRFAYADPPYLGMCAKYGHHHGDDGRCWDLVETHDALIGRLSQYDGWAMSLSSPSLRTILPLCPDTVRVGAWVKTFGAFQPNVNPAYVWEPVIWQPAYKSLGRDVATVSDWVGARITFERGFYGAKPETFAHWVISILGVGPDDTFDDLFHGSGAVKKAYERWRAQLRLGLETVA